MDWNAQSEIKCQIRLSFKLWVLSIMSSNKEVTKIYVAKQQEISMGNNVEKKEILSIIEGNVN